MSNPKPRSRKAWSKPLADLVAPCLTPSLEKFGFGQADLLLFWPEIVGERLAARCEPLRLQWPPRGRDQTAAPAPATLVVRVEGAFAIELQHQAALVMERVNVHFGWKCIGRIQLRQGPVSRPAPARLPAPPPASAAVLRARSATDGVAEDALRNALIRLGSRVFSE